MKKTAKKKTAPAKQQSTWHEQHLAELTTGQKVADMVAKGMGSWPFIIIQTIFVCIWMALNIIGWMFHWDVYPFILLNLIFSIQAAYAAPIIMMAQNRQNERDRVQAADDYHTNVDAKKEIEALQIALARIEKEQLSEIIKKLDELKK